MKSLIIIWAAFLMMLATPAVFSTIDNSITDDYSQSIAGVSTGSGVYSANITLGQAVFNDNVASISAITSNVTTDAPTASSYNSVSRAVEVTGLSASQLRTLTVAFTIDSPILPDSLVTFLVILRWFWVFVIIGFAGGAIYAFFD